jgi:cytochrome bd-type quinol oxidase subunit 1
MTGGGVLEVMTAAAASPHAVLALTTAHLLGFSVTIPNFPGIPDAWIVGGLFLAHIALAEFSVGAITLAAAMEGYGWRSGNSFARRYARAAANSYYLIFSLGATFAIFAVVAMVGFFGNGIGTLVNRFLPLVGIAMGLFIILAPLLVWYRNSFGRMRDRHHFLLGCCVAALQTLFVVLIVGLDGFLITPQNASFASVLNPAYVPLLVHRLIGNVGWTALLLAGLATLLARRSSDAEEHRFQFWAARVNLRIGLVATLMMPIDGFILVLVLHNVQIGYFGNLVGTYGGYMIAQEALVGAILVGGNIALAGERGGLRSSRVAQVATVLTTVGMVVACLPASVITPDILALRYVGLGAAVLVTAVHVVSRWNPSGLLIQAVRGVTLRRSLVLVGVASMVTALYMGFIKEQARGQYVVYGVLTQSSSHGRFLPPESNYP